MCYKYPFWFIILGGMLQSQFIYYSHRIFCLKVLRIPLIVINGFLLWEMIFEADKDDHCFYIEFINSSVVKDVILMMLFFFIFLLNSVFETSEKFTLSKYVHDPQIEVTFDLDTNGILSVTAKDKNTNKSESITITNDKGRLTKEEIDRMVQDAQKYKESDEKMANTVYAKNSYENYLFNMKNTMNEERGLKTKLSEDEKYQIESKLQEHLKWLEQNQFAEKEEYEQKQKEFSDFVQPIIARSYSQSQNESQNETGPSFDPFSFTNMNAGNNTDNNENSGPKIEDLD
jgi:hypothetical protein